MEGHERGPIGKLWHKWHLFHEVIAAYGLLELITHVVSNWQELVRTLHKLMELIQ